jgi:hypothetical protein
MKRLSRTCELAAMDLLTVMGLNRRFNSMDGDV